MANIQQAAASNPITDQNQAYVLAQLRAQRAQQMANMLTEEGSAPIDYDHHGAISWTQGLAKMLQSYKGRTMADDAMQQQAGVRTQGAQLLGQAHGMPSAADSPQQQGPVPTPSGAPAGAPAGAIGGAPTMPSAPSGPSPQALAVGLQGGGAQQGGVQPGRATPLNPFGAPPYISMMASQGDPGAKAQLETFLKNQELTRDQLNSRDPQIGESTRNNLKTQNFTELQKLQTARGLVADGSPQAQQIDDAISKANYIAPIDAKPGTPVLDPRTMKPTFFAPKVAEGVGLDFSKDPTNPTAHALDGYGNTSAYLEQQAARGKAAGGVQTAVGQNGATTTGYGSDLFGGGSGANPTPAPAPTAGKPPTDLNHMTPAQSKAFMDRAGATFDMQPGKTPGTHVVQGADPTVQTARTNQQTGMAEKWKPLNDAVTNAQTISSRLDTIKDLATKASTGQFADKMQFINSLLSFAGSEKATDANTAKVLLDKNSAQIVAQLGSGGMATDAARSILGSAYPNSHMPKEAIAEASDNLKAANTMMIAKAGVLQKHYLNNDPGAYQTAESDFNAAADPRIYQWKALASNPPAQAAYAAKLMKQDPTIHGRIDALEKMGALK